MAATFTGYHETWGVPRTTTLEATRAPFRRVAAVAEVSHFNPRNES